MHTGWFLIQFVPFFSSSFKYIITATQQMRVASSLFYFNDRTPMIRHEIVYHFQMCIRVCACVMCDSLQHRMNYCVFFRIHTIWAAHFFFLMGTRTIIYTHILTQLKWKFTEAYRPPIARGSTQLLSIYLLHTGLIGCFLSRVLLLVSICSTRNTT